MTRLESGLRLSRLERSALLYLDSESATWWEESGYECWLTQEGAEIAATLYTNHGDDQR